MIWTRKTVAVAVVALMVLVAGCSDDDDAAADEAGTDETTEPRLEGWNADICLVVARYSHDLAQPVEEFARESVDASGPAERRRLYLDAWDRVGEVNDELEQALEDLPPSGVRHGPPIVVAIRMALTDNREEEAYGVQVANELPDSAYEGSFVAGGSLVNGTEKMRAKVFLALQETAYKLGVEDFDGQCDAFTLLDAEADEDGDDDGS